MRRRTRGFTLLEVMVTVAVVGLLAMIAYPSYVAQIRRTHRADAKAALAQIAQTMERRMSEQGTYANATLGTNPATDVWSQPTTENGYYTLAFSTLTAGAFTLSATPVGDQANDSCGTFTYDDKGTKGSTGPVKDCW